MRLFLQFIVLSFAALAGVNPQLTQVRSIYILSMGSQMDQFLANRLSRMGVIQVAADPQSADAILTDRLGEGFEKRLDELYPAPVKDEDEDADVKKDESAQMRASSFGRGKGTYFIVDRKTRKVLWSIYERPKNSGNDELDKTAERIVNHLKKDLKPSTQQATPTP